MADRYMGVEQEFVSYKRSDPLRPVDSEDYFEDLKKAEKPFHKIGRVSLRSTSGHGFYVDGNEIEACTPPVRINRGFATRLTDLIMIGRDKIARGMPNAYHTGYSMHWNISRKAPEDEFFRGFAVPFHLFGINPLSSAINMRAKVGEEGGFRTELLGDYVTSEHQLNALALLLGSYSYAFDQANGNLPIIPVKDFELNEIERVFLPNGRFSTLRVYSDPLLWHNGMTEISAQSYLELFYRWVKPYAKKLGTPAEMKNLEGFIFGKKRLEFDQLKYFAFVHGEHGLRGGSYLPLDILDPNAPNKRLVADTKQRELPIEGRLFGEIAKLEGVKELKWTSFFHNGKRIEGIDNVFRYAHELNEEIPLPRSSPQVKSFNGGGILSLPFKQVGPTSYDASRDTFNEGDYKFLRNVGRNLYSSLKSRGVIYGSLGFALLSLIGHGVLSHFVGKAKERRDAAEYIFNLSTNQPALQNTNIITSTNGAAK